MASCRFRNVGNTCYLNAVLQALLVIEPFVDSLRQLGKDLSARLLGEEGPDATIVLDDDGISEVGRQPPTTKLVLDDDGGVTEQAEETEETEETADDRPDPKVLT